MRYVAPLGTLSGALSSNQSHTASGNPRGKAFRRIALALTIFGGLLLVLLSPKAGTQLPFEVPIRLDSGKSVEFAVELTRHRFYQIELVFPFQNAEQRAAARKLAGEPYPICHALKDCGVTPTFLVTVRHGTDVVLREEKTPIGIVAHSANGFHRTIAAMPLRPARYEITVEVIRSPEELAGYDARIQFTSDARSSDLTN